MRKYKKYQLILFLSFLIIIMFNISCIILINNRYNDYLALNSNYIINDTVEIILDTESLKNIEKNNYVYLNSNKKKIDIISTTRNIYQDKNKEYHQILIRIPGINSKTQLKISIFHKKERLIKLFIDMWKEFI